MFGSMEPRITFEIPSRLQLEALDNYTVLVTETQGTMDGTAATGTPSAQEAEQYEQLLADVWVGVVLTLMVLSCVCCMCSCLLYHKFQQWKRSVLEARANADISNIEHGLDNESLPSYTLVSGLPSYDEAVRQLQQIKQMTNPSDLNENKTTLEQDQQQNESTWTPSTPAPARLSVVDLFHLYKTNQSQTSTPTTNQVPQTTVAHLTTVTEATIPNEINKVS